MFRVPGLALTLVTLTAAAPAIAGQQEATANPVDAVAACRAVTDPAGRLACFDKAAADLVVARDKKDVVVLDREDVKKTRRSLFGFTLPRLPFLKGGDGKDEPEEEMKLETTIESTRSLGYGKWALRTPEGANWQTTEEGDFTPKSGDRILIRRGSLGGYFIKIGNKRAVRAIRVS